MQNLFNTFNSLPKFLRISTYFISGALALYFLSFWLICAVLAVSAYLVIQRKWLKYLAISFLALVGFVSLFIPTSPSTKTLESTTQTSTASATETAITQLPVQDVLIADTSSLEKGIVATSSSISKTETGKYTVVTVIDGDTIDVSKDGQTDRIRLIGIDTPETKDPRKEVECFGVEASQRATELMKGKSVTLEADPSQDNVDKYGRLLRFVFLENGTNVNLQMIKEGYAHEYTYDLPYKYQSDFKLAEAKAKASKLGLWGASCTVVVAPTKSQEQPVTNQTNTTLIPVAPTTQTTGSCNIKGNINSDDEKIYHTTDCAYYSKTKIDTSKGERWFCTEAEAVSAGWRKAKNCD